MKKAVYCFLLGLLVAAGPLAGELSEIGNDFYKYVSLAAIDKEFPAIVTDFLTDLDKKTFLQAGLRCNPDLLQRFRISLKAAYQFAANEAFGGDRIAAGIGLVFLP